MITPGSGFNDNDRIEDDKEQTGFDRGVDFNTMKDKLIKEYHTIITDRDQLDPNDKAYDSKKANLMRRQMYVVIAMIQLRNGSRISEAVEAFSLFMEPDRVVSEKVSVKIAKSKTLKYKKGTNEKYITKTRYRKMIYPVDWIDTNIPQVDDIRDYLENYEGNLKKRVLDYLLHKHQCNTHSLRYAFINHMLYEQKKEMALVAKFVGHSNVSQLVRYTQAKEADKLFNLDI
jgi:hypothetical protein